MLHNIKYDLLIVGAGLYGATIANLGKQHGLRCLVLERRPYIGGNIRDEVVNGVNVHLYGAHIFHTSNKDVWRFVQKFATFNDYIHEVLTRNGDQLIHLPLNLSTFYDVYHVSSPQDIITILQEEHAKEYYAFPINLEQKAIPYTPTIEHKHFVHDKDSPYTVITKEYPTNWEKGKEAYYPIETDRNLRLYNLYVDYIKHTYPTIKLGGRLGQYKYFDMDDTIKLAMEDFRRNYV